MSALIVTYAITLGLMLVLGYWSGLSDYRALVDRIEILEGRADHLEDQLDILRESAQEKLDPEALELIKKYLEDQA